VITRFIAGGGGVALRGALALDPDRFETVFITGPGGPLAERASEAGIEVLILRHMRPELAPREAFASAREIRTLLEVGRFDVVHTHSTKAGALGRFAARAAGVPAVVHTFHGFPFHDFQSPLRRAAYIAAERRLGRITDRFIAVGVSVAAEAVRLGLAAPERMRVISVSIEGRSVPQTPQTRARARHLLGIPEQAELIGTVGRIDAQKAPHHFVEAIARMARPDLHAVWIGEGPLRSQAESLIRRRGLGGRVHLIGERSDVADLLPGLDVFVMTSLYEGLPCAIVEAMRCGLPVVASAPLHPLCATARPSEARRPRSCRASFVRRGCRTPPVPSSHQPPTTITCPPGSAASTARHVPSSRICSAIFPARRRSSFRAASTR